MRKARFVFSQLTPKQKVRKNAEEQTKEFTPATACYVADDRGTSARAYNKTMAHVQRKHDSAHEHRRHAAYATETSGLLLIAFLLLVLTLVRYWHVIHWSVR
jgi:hypothetical protein